MAVLKKEAPRLFNLGSVDAPASKRGRSCVYNGPFSPRVPLPLLMTVPCPLLPPRISRCLRRDRHNLLRPETLESLYYMYWITGEELYREQAWMIFKAFEQHCRVDWGGYAGLKDVTDVRGRGMCAVCYHPRRWSFFDASIEGGLIYLFMR